MITDEERYFAELARLEAQAQQRMNEDVARQEENKARYYADLRDAENRYFSRLRRK